VKQHRANASPRAAAWALAALLLAAPMAHAGPLGFATPPVEIAQRVMNNAPGSIVVGVSRQGHTQFAMQRNGVAQPGPVQEIAADGQPIFEVGSISKLFTGVLLAQAVERGDLSLDDTVGQLLAGQVTLPPDIAAITLRQLVTHGACLPGMLPGASPMADGNPFVHPDRAQLLIGLSTLKLDRRPPCNGPYSSLRLGLLGQLLADRYGKPAGHEGHGAVPGPRCPTARPRLRQQVATHALGFRRARGRRCVALDSGRPAGVRARAHGGAQGPAGRGGRTRTHAAGP